MINMTIFFSAHKYLMIFICEINIYWTEATWVYLIIHTSFLMLKI